MADPNPRDPRLVAIVDLVGRSGASEFTFRYSDDEEPTPTALEREFTPSR